jgi:carbamoyltransferase
MTTILGLHDGHDCSAAVMIDGKVISAAQEERFSGLKMDCGYPEKAIEACLRLAGVSAVDLDEVVVATENYLPVLTKLKRDTVFSIEDHVTEQYKFWKPLKQGETPSYWDIYKDRDDLDFDSPYPTDDYMDYYLSPEDKVKVAEIRLTSIAEKLGIPRSKIRIINHEICHVYYAYYASPLRGDTLALTADSFGDHSNGTVSLISNSSQEYLDTTDENYIARVYRYITLLLGLKPLHHEYKVMGLAPYANSYEIAKCKEAFSMIQKLEGTKIRLDQKPPDLFFHFKEILECHRFDGIAGALQEWTEDVLCEWLANSINETGRSNVVFSGGVAQNIKACKSMAEIDGVSDFYVAPAAGDTSIPIGACYFATWENLKKTKGDVGSIKDLENIYLGTDFSDADVRASLEKNRAQERYTISESVTPDRIAGLLESGKIIGRCSGRMEFGMRSLGNRSILADPRNPDTVKKINDAIKYRDFWMPFTPSILSERADDYIVNPKKLKSPYMTMAFDSTKLAQEHLAAAMHPADMTVRPQILEKQKNPEYHAIISEFEKRTGVGGVLNTSFNLHGHPIVLGPDESLFTMANSDLDAVVIGNFLVEKPN